MKLKPVTKFDKLADNETFYLGFIVATRGNKFWVRDASGCNPMPGACHFTSWLRAYDGIDVLLFCEPDGHRAADHFWEIMQPFSGYELGKIAPGWLKDSIVLEQYVTKGRFHAHVNSLGVVDKLWISESRPWDGRPECVRLHKQGEKVQA